MAPYYQPVLDLIAANPPPNGSLDLVRQLCEAVDAEHGEKITLLTLRVVKDVNPRMSPPVLIPEEVVYETMARLLFMGEHADLELILEWYERPTSFASTQKERISEHWAGIFAFITVPPPGLSEKELDRQLTRITTALRCVLPAHAAAVAQEGPVHVPDPSTGELPPGSFGTSTFGRPARSVVLSDGIRKLVLSWMAVHQQLLEAARQHLGSKTKDRGQKLLALRGRWHQALSLTFDNPRLKRSAQLKQLEIELARIDYGRSPRHRYVDAFVPGARAFGFTPYDRDSPAEPAGKSVWLADLFRYRGSQLHFLLDEFGEYYVDPTAAQRMTAPNETRRKATFAARRKLIDEVEKREASLRLESEDDLVSFGCAFVRALLGGTTMPSPDDSLKAWNPFLHILDRHLKTHTTHTEFNLDEKPVYFDRLFPRAINGGALHDCGVYAVRLAFVLLSVAHCVQAAGAKPPRVSFIVLPLHVGLLVEIDGFPPLVVHNEILFRLTPEDTAAARSEWGFSGEPSDPTDPELLHQKFLEDLAAQLFLRDVDLPLLRLPIAPVSVPPKKREIWKAYELVVERIDRLFSSRVRDRYDPGFQFDLRFLSILTLEKRWHDATVVPFWNRDCFGLWTQFKGSLERHGKREEFAKALEGHLTRVDESYDKDIRPTKDQLNKDFRANPDLLAKPAPRITDSGRLEDLGSAQGPVGRVRDYVAELRYASGAVPEPPFATEANFLARHGE